jgi:hypothetical protein
VSVSPLSVPFGKWGAKFSSFSFWIFYPI